MIWQWEGASGWWAAGLQVCRFSRCLISWDPATRRLRGGLPTACKLGPPLETHGTKLRNGCSSDTLSQPITLFLIVECRMKKKLFLDVDTGVDDAQAIMMALAAPDVEILGITCCHGNTSLENALKNTLRVLKVCNRLDVSVCVKACIPWLLFCGYSISTCFTKGNLWYSTDPGVPWLRRTHDSE